MEEKEIDIKNKSGLCLHFHIHSGILHLRRNIYKVLFSIFLI